MGRRRLLVSLIVLVIILGGSITAFVLTHQQDPKTAYLKSAVQISKDKDTGEQVITDPNLKPQTNEARAVIVLGIENLLNLGVLQVQTTFIKDSLNTFSSKQLQNKYDTLTIRPEGLIIKDGVITTTLRLGQTDATLPIVITAKNTGETRVVVQDNTNKYGGGYDSGAKIFTAD